MPFTNDNRTQRGSNQRGYGYRHQQERRRLQPLVDSGQAYCAQPKCLHPTRWIEPGTPWALGHNDDRTAYLGPTHALCNQRDGASRGGQVIAERRNPRRSNPDATAPTGWRSRAW